MTPEEQFAEGRKFGGDVIDQALDDILNQQALLSAFVKILATANRIDDAPSRQNFRDAAFFSAAEKLGEAISFLAGENIISPTPESLNQLH